ncbi:MAG TPA: HAD family phosphatase [Solirubrobacterales bacterium]|jgi:beta-phosphoglucomutase-like phosphatase (HAD superfamily)
MTLDNPFDSGRPRPIATVLDSLRARIDAERFDGVVLWLEAVAADLGYGDVRPLPGAVAWIRELRGTDKKVALAGSGERARAALDLAGMADLFDAVVTGPRNSGTAVEAAKQLGVEPGDAILVDVSPAGIQAGREAKFDLLIGVARNLGTPDDLRRAGADMVVADLQELLGSAHGIDR